MNWEHPGYEELKEKARVITMRYGLPDGDHLTDVPVGWEEWTLFMDYLEATASIIEEVQRWRAAGRSGYSLPCIRGEALEAIEAFLNTPTVAEYYDNMHKRSILETLAALDELKEGK